MRRPAVSALPAYCHEVQTPAFVLDEEVLDRAVARAAAFAREAGCRLLYAMKPLTLIPGLRKIAPSVSGFSASSPFEARLAREVLGPGGAVHLTAPGLRPQDLPRLGELCDFVVFNSLSQWRRMASELASHCSRGLRVNPRFSRVKDARYDPCRIDSKLGAPIELVREAHLGGELGDLEGLHFHNSCDSEDLAALTETLGRIEQELPDLLHQISWINLGGGYLFDRPRNRDAFLTAVTRLRQRYGLEVYLEPGATMVRSAGSFVATVIDLLPGDTAPVALLDTTVHHMPEVFEYQWSPPIETAHEDGEHRYVVAGSSCLAGDVFGTYDFPQPLEVGSKVRFVDIGAYSLVKASMFNGINLPSIYLLNELREPILVTRLTYQDFLRLNGLRLNGRSLRDASL